MKKGKHVTNSSSVILMSVYMQVIMCGKATKEHVTHFIFYIIIIIFILVTQNIVTSCV